MTKIWLGLGNDEAKYLNTRHNVGWMLLDYIAQQNTAEFSTQSLAYVAQVKDLYLVKLKSYMNLSGENLQKVLNYYKWNLDDVLVIYDDIDFEVGSVKLRFNGGDGGHRGMGSIIEQFGSQDIWRLRLGIRGEFPEFKSKDHKSRFIVNYVLSPFQVAELAKVRETFSRINPHIGLIAEDPKRAMNLVNRSA